LRSKLRLYAKQVDLEAIDFGSGIGSLDVLSSSAPVIAVYPYHALNISLRGMFSSAAIRESEEGVSPLWLLARQAMDSSRRLGGEHAD
jgi:hypothetical protein